MRYRYSLICVFLVIIFGICASSVATTLEFEINTNTELRLLEEKVLPSVLYENSVITKQYLISQNEYVVNVKIIDFDRIEIREPNLSQHALEDIQEKTTEVEYSILEYTGSNNFRGHKLAIIDFKPYEFDPSLQSYYKYENIKFEIELEENYIVKMAGSQDNLYNNATTQTCNK